MRSRTQTIFKADGDPHGDSALTDGQLDYIKNLLNRFLSNAHNTGLQGSSKLRICKPAERIGGRIRFQIKNVTKVDANTNERINQRLPGFGMSFKMTKQVSRMSGSHRDVPVWYIECDEAELKRLYIKSQMSMTFLVCVLFLIVSIFGVVWALLEHTKETEFRWRPIAILLGPVTG